MKTTIDISDALFEQARAQAKARGVTLRTLVESGLRLALAQSKPAAKPFQLRDLSFGSTAPGATLEAASDPRQWRALANPGWTLQDGQLVPASAESPAP